MLGAYQLLESEGYIVPKASSGFYVNPDYNLFQDSVHLDWETQSDAKYIFSQNGLELSKIPKKSLARIYRNAIYDQPDLFSHGEKPGELITFLHVFAAFSEKIQFGDWKIRATAALSAAFKTAFQKQDY